MATTQTPEQQAIIAAVQAAQPGATVVIEARAGAGKTYTAREICKTYPASTKILYMAFNKSTQVEADRSFPKNVSCRTSHSLAWSFGRKYTHRMTKPMGKATRVRYSDAARQLGIQDATIGNELLGADRVLRIAMSAVNRWCRTADAEVTQSHIWREQGIDNHDKLVKVILPVAKLAWNDIENGHVLNVNGEHYIKMWQLSKPRLNFDVIIYDEAQDANGAVANVVERQTQAVRAIIGDGAQAINGWNGAVNAIKKFAETAGVVLPLSKSFRFGQAIADTGNLFLRLLEVPENTLVKGFEQIHSMVGMLVTPDAVLCRTNGGCIAVAMDYLATGRRVHIVGGGKTYKELAEGAQHLQAGRRSYHPDLAAFKTWEEVVEYAKDDEGADLRPFVKLISEHGAQAIIAAMDRLTYKAEYADIVVSTMHKAKGLEWKCVQIGPDVKAPKQNTEGRFTEMLTEEQLMLFYVAVTRAQEVLDIGSLGFIYEYVAQMGYELAA